jgi:hypothetical protein
MHLGELSRRDERVGGLLHPVVEKPIGAAPAEEQPLPHGFLERLAELCRRTTRDHREGVEVQAAAEARGELERVLRWDREPLQLTRHQLTDVVGEALVADRGDVPLPRPLLRIEGDEPLLVQRAQELEREEGVTAGLFIDQPRERLDRLGAGVDRLGDERSDMGGGERREDDVGDDSAALPRLGQREQQRVRGADLVVAIGAESCRRPSARSGSVPQRPWPAA